jgi:hypothetical protein
MKISIKIFPSKKIEIPKEFKTIQDYDNFIKLVYDALINQYNNLLQVLSQLNDPHLNKIINKSYPPDIIKSDFKEDIDYASEELSPLYFRYISEFIHLLASDTDGLFQYYYFLFKWLYAYWKITTYNKINELLKGLSKKFEENKLLLKQKQDEKIQKMSEIENAAKLLNQSNNKEDMFNQKYPTFMEELKILETNKTKYENNIENINTFISDHYSDYDDQDHKVYKDKESFKQQIDQYQYNELYKKLKLMEGNMKETTSRVSLTHSKMRETIAKAMEQEANHQDYIRNVKSNKQSGGKRRTRKWYKFQKRVIRNTMKYLKYREKKR